MKIRYHRSFWLLGSVVLLALAAGFGCVRRTTATSDTISSAPVYQSDRAMIVHRGDDSQRLYYRDDNGKIYFVDSSGKPNLIERNVRVERGNAGLYYIIDDDNVKYYTNDRGRLYYRDNSGRDVFIEESGTGAVIDPLPILRGEGYPRVEHIRSQPSCNSVWRQCTAQCYNSPGFTNSRPCLESCDTQRERCLNP